MWFVEHTIEASAAPEAIWKLWEDVPNWSQWNADLEGAELSGAFVPGSAIRMRSVGGDTIDLKIAEAVEPEVFIDEADLGTIVVRTIHRAEAIAPGRTRIVYGMEITGPDADAMGPELGPQISGDFPQVLEALARRAEG